MCYNCFAPGNVTGSAVFIIKLDDYRVAVVGDAEGHAGVIDQCDGGQTGVKLRLAGDDVDGRLPIALRDGVVSMPGGWT